MELFRISASRIEEREVMEIVDVMAEDAKSAIDLLHSTIKSNLMMQVEDISLSRFKQEDCENKDITYVDEIVFTSISENHITYMSMPDPDDHDNITISCKKHLPIKSDSGSTMLKCSKCGCDFIEYNTSLTGFESGTVSLDDDGGIILSHRKSKSDFNDPNYICTNCGFDSFSIDDFRG